MTTTSEDGGKWMLVRSDRFIIYIDRPNTPCVIGRSRSLPPAQQLQGRYVSREQLRVEWRPPHLVVTQAGKNPTFYDTACRAVPAAGAASGLTFMAEAKASLPTWRESGVLIPMLTEYAEATTAPDRSEVSAATLFFPSEVGLPSLTVRYLAGASSAAAATAADACAATTSLSAAQMLSVPVVAGLGAMDEEEEEAGASSSVGRAHGGSGGGQAWQGLLDIALQQKEQEEAKTAAAAAATAAAVPTAAATPPPPAPPAVKRPVAPPAAPPAPVEIPFGAAAAPADAKLLLDEEDEQMQKPAQPPQQVKPPPAAPSPAHQMGMWEWKCRANAPDKDPKSWRRYPRAVADLLEEAYRARKMKVAVPDRLLRGDSTISEKQTTYVVCFAEKSMGGGMVQLVEEDPLKYRGVRRVGGSDVDRSGLKPLEMIPDVSSSSESGFSETLSDSSFSSSSASSSSSGSDAPQKKRRRTTRK